MHGSSNKDYDRYKMKKKNEMNNQIEIDGKYVHWWQNISIVMRQIGFNFQQQSKICKCSE